MTIQFKQSIVRTAFDRPTLIKHNNFITITNRTEPVGNNHTTTPPAAEMMIDR
jgi:hypothetical protein